MTTLHAESKEDVQTSKNLKNYSSCMVAVMVNIYPGSAEKVFG